MSLSDLKQQLDIAVSEESFSEAARLRDRIQEISHDMHAAVDYANTRFYESFQNADSDAMAAVWGDGESVQCIHPGMAALVGARLQSPHQQCALEPASHDNSNSNQRNISPLDCSRS